MRPRRAFVAFPRHPLTGKQFRVSARTDRELAALLQDIDSLRADLNHGRKTPSEIDRALRRVRRGTWTLARIAAAYELGAAANTRRRVRSFLAAAAAELATLDVYELSADRLTRWIARLKSEGYESSTIATAWRTLSALGRHAAERGWIGAPPWGAWRPTGLSSRPARLREAARDLVELGRLLAAAAELDAQRGPWSFVEMAIACIALLGVRQGELAGLRLSDFDRDRLTVRIERQWMSAPLKNRRPTALRAAPWLFELLTRHVARLETIGLANAYGPVFPHPSSTPGHARAYSSGEVLTRRNLRNAVRMASLPNATAWSATSLRDTFATLEQFGHGGDLRALAQRTRHASIASLARYLRARTREPVAPGFEPLLVPSPAPPDITKKLRR